MNSNQNEEVIRYTCCEGGGCFGRVCIVKVRIRNGMIIACEPDDTINPNIPREDEHLSEYVIDRGMVQNRPCPKGYAKMHAVYDSKRVIYPMKRIGARGEGKFERISWDEALDTIARKLEETKKKFGPYSILHQPYTGSGVCSFPLAPWFGAGFAGWGLHSQNGWAEPEYWVLGKNSRTQTLRQDEIQIFNSKLIVFWGLNPQAILNGGWLYNLIRAKEKGISIICIEPRYTPSVELLADQWIPIRPTTDVTMMIAMANVWFKEELYDKEFVEKWVEPEGLQLWKSYVLGHEDGLDKGPQWAEKICGVPAETIIDFARLYARSKPVNLNVSWAIGRQFYGENPARAAMYLQALTGNYFLAGGTAAAETGMWQGKAVWPKPVVDWQRKPGSYKPPTLLAAYKWPKAIELRKKLDREEISQAEYNNAIGNKDDNPSPNIQMVIIEGNNHLNTLPDINASVEAIKNVDSVVVFSKYTDQDTARYADILLPHINNWYEGRSSGPFGLVGIQTDLFRFATAPTNYFIYCQKCIDPIGEVRPHDWVWTQIAKRLGIAESYNPRMANVSIEKWDDTVENLHREAYEKWAAREDIITLNPPSWEEFQKKPVFRFEINEPYHPFQEDFEKGENPFKETLSGKVEFFSKVLANGPDYLAHHDYMPPGSGKCYGGGNLPPMAQWTPGGSDTFFSKKAVKYPLLASSPHSYYRENSAHDNNQWLSNDCYRHAVWMNVADAKVRDIKDDDQVRVYNDIGELVIPAYVTSRIIPGIVYIFFGGWYTRGRDKTRLMPDGIDRRGAVNLLVHNEDLPKTIVDHFPTKALVQVEKWEGMVK
ncbi:molybdopterin-dependent oxidoreductase [Chloroflexota bacterium]